MKRFIHSRGQSSTLIAVLDLVEISRGARAAAPTEGAILGQVRDLDTGQPVPGVTVVASGPEQLPKIVVPDHAAARHRRGLIHPAPVCIAYRSHLDVRLFFDRRHMDATDEAEADKADVDALVSAQHAAGRKGGQSNSAGFEKSRRDMELIEFDVVFIGPAYTSGS